MVGFSVVGGFYLATGLLQLAFAVVLLRPPRRDWSWLLAALFACNGLGALATGVQDTPGWRLPARHIYEVLEQSTMFLLAWFALSFPRPAAPFRRRPWLLTALFLTPMLALASAHLLGLDGAFYLARSLDTPVDLPRLLVGFVGPAAVWSILLVRWTRAWLSDLEPRERAQTQVIFAAFGMRAASILVVTLWVGKPGPALLLGLAQAANLLPLLVLLACLATLALARPRPGRSRGATFFVAGFLVAGLCIGSLGAALGSALSPLKDTYYHFDLYAVRPAFVWYAVARLGLLGPQRWSGRAGAALLAGFAYPTLCLMLAGGLGRIGPVLGPLATLGAAAVLTAILVGAAWPVLSGRATPALAAGAVGWLPGEVVLGRYRLEALLGEGSAGEAHLAWDTQERHRVVLKRVRGLAPTQARALLHEARVLERLASPRIVRLLAVAGDEAAPVLVLEHLPGSLRDRLADGRPLPPGEAVAIARAVLEALEASHGAGVLHRDVKPANILLDGRGGAKLADFGVARLPAVPLLGNATVEGAAPVGSLRYMAPEQLRGLPADARSDLYAVAVVLWEMLEGRHPVAQEAGDYETRRAIVEVGVPPLPARVPRRLAEVVERGLHRQPSRRFASARAFARALAAAYPERKTSSERPTPTTSPVRSG